MSMSGQGWSFELLKQFPPDPVKKIRLSCALFSVSLHFVKQPLLWQADPSRFQPSRGPAQPDQRLILRGAYRAQKIFPQQYVLNVDKDPALLEGSIGASARRMNVGRNG